MFPRLSTPCEEVTGQKELPIVLPNGNATPYTGEPPSSSGSVGEMPETVTIFGLPLARLTVSETLERIEDLIVRGEPSFFITANLNYAMLCARDPSLQAVNAKAAFLVADGMPLVWYSRLGKRPLPERVTGADLLGLLFDRAAARGYRVCLLGGPPGVAAQVARQARELHPSLKIVGVEWPDLEALTREEHDALLERIRQARPDLLLVAFGQPKGERWLAQFIEQLGVPVAVQLGASFEFYAGRISRAPRWMQLLGAEWLHRLLQEPRRLGLRYAQNVCFLAAAVWTDIWEWLKKFASGGRRPKFTGGERQTDR